MKIKWLAHASFLITSEQGIRILTDPYNTEKGVNHAPLKESADIVTVSHDHFDHNAFTVVSGNPEKVASDGVKEVRGIQFKGIPVYHDESKGRERGNNIIFCFTVDGIRLCHLGDLGHMLEDKEVNEIGEVDILLIPVGGFFTIDAEVAGKVCSVLKPKVTIPMHYKNPKLDFPIEGVDPFIQGKKNVVKKDTNEVAFTAGALPSDGEIVVLLPAY